jgi:hypothetical protein
MECENLKRKRQSLQNDVQLLKLDIEKLTFKIEEINNQLIKICSHTTAIKYSPPWGVEDNEHYICNHCNLEIPWRQDLIVTKTIIK